MRWNLRCGIFFAGNSLVLRIGLPLFGRVGDCRPSASQLVCCCFGEKIQGALVGRSAHIARRSPSSWTSYSLRPDRGLPRIPLSFARTVRVGFSTLLSLRGWLRAGGNFLREMLALMKIVAPRVVFSHGAEIGKGQISLPGQLPMGWIRLIVEDGFEEIWRIAHFT